MEPISQDRGRDLVTANNRTGIVLHNFASQLDISKLNGVALIRAGVGDFLGVDLFGMVAELRFHMMSLVLRPIFLGHTRPRAPKASGCPPWRERTREFFGAVSGDLLGETARAEDGKPFGFLRAGCRAQELYQPAFLTLRVSYCSRWDQATRRIA